MPEPVLLPEQLEKVIKYKHSLMPEAHNTLREECFLIQEAVVTAVPALIRIADQGYEALCLLALTEDPDLFIEIYDDFRTEAICTAAGCIWPPSLEAAEGEGEGEGG